MVAGLDGDGRSHEALLRAIRPMVAGYFTRRIRREPEAIEDLVQEVLIGIHQRRASYDRTRPLTPWIYAIARHKLVDHLRRFRRFRRHKPIAPLEEMLSDESFEASSDARLDIARLLSLLPDKQANAIRYTRLQEMSVAEAARLAGIGESDLKVSAHRGIRALSARVARAAGLAGGMAAA